MKWQVWLLFLLCVLWFSCLGCSSLVSAHYKPKCGSMGNMFSDHECYAPIAEVNLHLINLIPTW